MLTVKEIAALGKARRQANEKVGGRGGGVINFDGRGGVVRARFRYVDPGGRRVDVPLGTVGADSTLAELRTRAAELAALRLQHPDLRQWLQDQAEAERRAAQASRAKGSLHDLLGDYLADLERRRGAPASRDVRRMFERDVVKAHPALADRAAAAIGPADIAAILKTLWERGAKVATNQLRSYLHAAFAFGLHHEHDVARSSTKVYGLSSNPVAATPVQREAKRSGTRALTADELRKFYTDIPGTTGVSPVVAAFLQFLVALGGQRPAQVLRVPWTGYDLEQNTIEIHDSKGRGSRDRVHLVPLSHRALGLLQWVKPITGRLDHPWASLRAKGQPLGLMTIAHTIDRFLDARPELAPFTARDLRRTTKQLALRAGIPLHDVNLLQHHGMTGVAVQHYANSPEAFLPQLREIMARWDAALGRLLAGEPLQEPPAAPPKRARARAKPEA